MVELSLGALARPCGGMFPAFHSRNTDWASKVSSRLANRINFFEGLCLPRSFLDLAVLAAILINVGRSIRSPPIAGITSNMPSLGGTGFLLCGPREALLESPVPSLVEEFDFRDRACWSVILS